MTTERIADHVKFAYWVPNVSGGLVTSGFEYALSQVRYEASYGAEYQHESTSFSPALLLATQKLKVIPREGSKLMEPQLIPEANVAPADSRSWNTKPSLLAHRWQLR